MQMINNQGKPASREHIQAIAYLVNALRTDWDRPGLEAVLARCDTSDLARLATAAIAFATTRPDQRTPAALAADGRHWHTNQPGWTASQPAALCATCGYAEPAHTAATMANLAIPEHAFRPESRRRAATDVNRSEHVRALAAKVRAEIRPAPQPTDAPKTGLDADLSHEHPKTGRAGRPGMALGPQIGAQQLPDDDQKN